MSNYVIFTDSACDIPSDMLAEWGVQKCDLTYSFAGEDKEYREKDMAAADFYQKMRDGGVAQTAAINIKTFTDAFEEYVKAGTDILYLGFSSGLSTTFNSGRMAMEDLKSRYPERKLLAVDSLAAAAGFGLLLYLTVKQQKAGASIEEAAAYAENTRLHLCHWFTVDDLVYLKRGGRISPTVAFVGNVLGIKPILHVDNDGHLINMGKVRGRRSAIKAMADKFGELAEGAPAENTIFIGQADCIADAELLGDMLEKQYGAKVEKILNIGNVIGAHSGPGTLALFFLGKER